MSTQTKVMNSQMKMAGAMSTTAKVTWSFAVFLSKIYKYYIQIAFKALSGHPGTKILATNKVSYNTM